MRRSAVIFVLIFTLIIANICTGCGSSAPNQDNGSAKTESGGSSDAAGKTDASGKSGDAGKSDAAGKTGDASSIPDTNESAVSDWGTADAGTKNSSGEGGPAPAFSQVLIDNDDLYFAIKDVRSDAAYGYEWKVYVENRTRVDFTLNVYNNDDYTEAALMHDPFTVFPLGEDKASSAVREPAATDHVLVDDDNCSVIITGYEPDNSWGYAMKLYLVNKTDRDMVFSVDDSSVNGIMCDPFWADIVCAGKTSYSTVLWDKNALTENDITEVEEISLPLKVYADEDMGNPYVDDTFELTPGAE